MPNYRGLPLLGLLCFVWLLGNLGEVRVIQELAVVSILVAVVWTLLGTDVVRALSFPLAFLFFAVPFGTSLVRPLQDFTAWFVIRALTISHVPAVLENHAISLPTSVWMVAEACSGLRFLLSSVVLGTLYSFLMYQSRMRRLVFVCASIIVPIVGNGLRAYGTILLGYFTNNRFAAGVDHIVYGGLFAALIQLLLMLVGLKWRQSWDPIKPIDSNRSSLAALRTDDDFPPAGHAFFVAIAACVLIVLAPLVAAHLWNRAATTSDWADPPVMVTAPWQPAAEGDMSWALAWRNQDREFNQGYRLETSQVDVHWVLYSGRREMNWATTSDGTVDTEGWTIASDGFAAVNVGGQPFKVYRSVIQSGAASRTVWTWYWVSGEYTASRARVRFLQAKARFRGKPAAVAVISLGTDSQEDSSQAEEILRNFLLHASFLTGSGQASPIS